ncbi:MAG TPA: RsiV family protein [Aggregatilineaceae bacterium]|nr:RsiV family protein [Aggregatilineaceae bacterium]
MRAMKGNLGGLVAAGLLILGLHAGTARSSGLDGAMLAATATPETAWTLTDATTQENSQKQDFAIVIHRPVLAPASAAFNAAIQKITDSAATSFKQFVATSTGGPGVTSTLTIDYDVMVIRQRLVSVRFSILQYVNGMAHPSLTAVSVNFDRGTDKVLALADLFKSNAKYLEALAKYCSADLMRQGRLSFPEGAAAKAENYAAWNLDRAGLLITFDPATVVASAAGPSVVLVPYTALDDLLGTTVPVF